MGIGGHMETLELELDREDDGRWLAEIRALPCSPVMEVMRPDPVDISQFSVGEDRTRITQVLGAPQATVKEGKLNCDSL
ncbi:MAG TPA: hypothetical protein VGY99_25515 [Candidatus Binataceae bacterium]|jgi:hypothetical protein|nr:hypothetical protein [Candidatus Binataceae bacterium]